MKQSVTLPTSPGSPTATGADETGLHGRWLFAARIGWVVVTLTILLLNLLTVPDLYSSNFTFTPQVLQELHRVGLSPTLYGVLGLILGVSFQLVYLPLGLLLFWRRSTDRMALFCAFTLVTFGGAVPLYDFGSGGIDPTLVTNPLLRVVALALFVAGEACLVLFFYLFPSGRFVPRWTRWVTLPVVAYYVVIFVFPALLSPSTPGPTAFLVPLFLLTAVVAQVYRYRRASTPKERQQTKWVVFGFALAIVLIVAYLVTIPLQPQALADSPVLFNLVGSSVFILAFLLIPIFIVIAILRSRLWDIDVLINRALVYGSLTAILAALYAGLIIGLESAAGLFTRQASQPVVLVISTLAIAALFTPLRQRIQALIDRRFYRRKYDAEKTLAAFSETLRNEVNLSDLRAHLIAVVNETMQPAYVSLWLRQPEQHPTERAYRPEVQDQEATRPRRS